MDAAYSRENLAQVLETKGNLIEAKEGRRSDAPGALVCINLSCTIDICKSVYYCSEKKDWTTHHKSLCRAAQ